MFTLIFFCVLKQFGEEIKKKMNSLKIFVVFAIALLGLYWNYLYIAQYGRHACSYLFLFFKKDYQM